MTTAADGPSVFAKYIVDTKTEPSKPAQPPWPESAQRLLDWLQKRWGKPDISIRDIRVYGPNSIRDRKSAIATAEILAERGLIYPLKAHRYDRRVWRVAIFETERL